METHACVCGQRLYFENTSCLRCGRGVGFCPGCGKMASFEPVDAAAKSDDAAAKAHVFVCTDEACGARIMLCYNRVEHGVCNRGMLADRPPPGGTPGQPLCDMCKFNVTIPDLTVAANLSHWARLESAKRRVLRQFQVLGLPPYGRGDAAPPLRFDFKADAIPTGVGWRPMGDQAVFTGHKDGTITLNVKEADPVERERLRVSFGESHRTLVGHFRHELAHYLWQSLVTATPHEAGVHRVFGDPMDPPYAEAKKAYYEQGPQPDWPSRHVSAYASMHPFEDWAESTAAFFTAFAVAETAFFHGRLDEPPREMGVDALIDRFVEDGIYLNEVNREIGLIDTVASVFTPLVREKIACVHGVLLG